MRRLSPDTGRVALAAITLAALIVGTALLSALRTHLMQHRLILAAALAAVCLAGCSSLSQANQDALAAAVAAKIPYCSGDIQVEAGIGGLAGTGTGIKNAGQLHCPGKPYETAPAAPQPAPAAQ